MHVINNNKEQFNIQANKYAEWKFTKERNYLEGFSLFCNIKDNDTILDVACGTGNFALFASKIAKHATGIDISNIEIDIAKKIAEDLRIKNVNFDCGNVERLPYEKDNFSVVVSRYAFHHFNWSEVVFEEMVRCCEIGGKICIHDVVSYENDYLDCFFNEFDKLVDASHNKLLKMSELKDLFKQKQIEILDELIVTVELNVNDYINHAVQNSNSENNLKKILEKCKEDQALIDYLFLKMDELYFKRDIAIILGRKTN